MEKSFIFLMLTFLVFIYGCSQDHSPVATGPEKEISSLMSLTQFPESPPDAIWKYAYKKFWLNCKLVQDAVEKFAARNKGIYASNVDVDKNLDGMTVVDLLPGGHLLENPFTRCASEPVNGSAACPGQIGYRPIVCRLSGGVYYNKGYEITGCGRDALRILIIFKYCDGEVVEIIGRRASPSG